MTNPNVEPGTILIIRTDGTEHIIKRSSKGTLDKIKQAIKAEGLDFVRIGKADWSDLVMAVDDFGWETITVVHSDNHMELKPVKANKPINPKATALYHAICLPGTTHQIVGDVAIMHDGEF